ncbi:MAG TPA: NmrA/HSCARG family protein, partial [Puia sp.]
MQHSKTIFVTGATGNQGGAVVRSLLNNGYAVKALTRNPTSKASQILKGLHAEIIQGDLNNIASFRDQIRDVYGIFSVLTFENGTNKEIKQGIDLANLAKACDIKHFIYSSLIGADLHTGIPHWESKFVIENHIRQIGLPYTIIRPASLFENFLIPAVRKRIVMGKLASPINKDIIQLFISSADIGKIGASIFMRPDSYLGRTIPLVSEEMNLEKVSAIFSEVLEKDIRYQKLPMFVTRLVMGKNLYKMFAWINVNSEILL